MIKEIYMGRSNLSCYFDPIDYYGCSRVVRASSEQEVLEESVQNLYGPTELAYARRLLDGIPSGTVLDWRK